MGFLLHFYREKELGYALMGLIFGFVNGEVMTGLKEGLNQDKDKSQSKLRISTNWFTF